MRKSFSLLFLILPVSGAWQAPGDDVFPEATWKTQTPQESGLQAKKLDELRDLVGGRGCVVQHAQMVYAWGDQKKSSDVASAVKPVISTLLLFAVQEARIASVDAKLSNVEPILKTLDSGKNANITWRHLASQTSGYGLSEPPGSAYSYNDYALALYYDTLMQKVFQDDGTHVLKTRLADELGFEDRYTFEALGRSDRVGRLAVSVRDFARFGLFYLRGGKWRDKQLLKPALIKMAIGSPIPPDVPLTTGKDTPMIPGQRTLGGGKNITPIGPGFYSFNWWLNTKDKLGRRLFADAPPDSYIASGHGGKRVLWVMPSLDLIVCWNDSDVDDHDSSPGNPSTKMNRAARLITESTRNRSEPFP